MTEAYCDAQLKRLTLLRGIPDAVYEYFAALKDIPDELFTRAVTHALKTRSFFPTPAELRLDCDVVFLRQTDRPAMHHVQALVGGGKTVTFKNPLPDAGRDLTIHITHEWKCDCDDCADSGWRSLHCPEQDCGRRFEHAPHEYVVRCHCIAWNPTIRRHMDANAKFSQAPAKHGR